MRLYGFDDLSDRLDQVQLAITGVPVKRTRPSPLADVFKSMSTTETRIVADPLRYLKQAIGLMGDGPLHVVLVDDVDRKHCHELFGRLRDGLWELPIQWVVAGTSASLDPPADTFFDAVVELPPFDQDGLRDLLERRAASGTPEEGGLLMKTADSVLDAVAPCTPRRALAVLRDLYLSNDLLEATRQLENLQSARADLKPTANRLVDALIHHGPTHAGDAELLDEVGVTRSRVVQLLAELEADGLVTAQREGRRKLYSVPGGRPMTADVRSEARNGETNEP
ncbi:MAG: hypothetical protein F4Z34_13745 [Acidimicrobiaceae bacterium]|nr:hypothetical protein [Acidimicrobiaceae bacterium]